MASCRLCGSRTTSVLDLGEQALTGRFPSSPTEAVPSGRLDLHRCPDCSLVQLADTPSPEMLYGAGYGYRSSLNSAMVAHLSLKARRLESVAGLRPGDQVLDIGSNDGTFLRALGTEGLDRIGVDPLVTSCADGYEGMTAIADLFAAERVRSARPDGVAPRLVTSIAMFYDLERPVEFAREVASILAPDGLWHFEQSYLPTMLRQCAYDTICHEHLEYYTLEIVRRILDEADLGIVDVEFNDVNGGSFAVTAAHVAGPRAASAPHVDWALASEIRRDPAGPEAFDEFADRVERHRTSLRDLVHGIRRAGHRVAAYGASTKGNVLLQHCGLGPEDLDFIIEVNPDKFGRFTPGTGIPIVPEDEGFDRDPDYLLVLPWHFRPGIVRREESFLRRGGRMIFPLPEIEVV